MKHGKESILLADSAASGRALRSAVRGALNPSRRWLRAGAIAVVLGAAIQLAEGAPFPPVFPVGSLLPAYGGDGSEGIVLAGIDDGEGDDQTVSTTRHVDVRGVGAE